MSKLLQWLHVLGSENRDAALAFSRGQACMIIGMPNEAT